LKIKIDTRLPLALFKENPLIYTGSDFRAFPKGFLLQKGLLQRGLFQRLYPITVSKVIRNNLLVDQMFCFSFFYVTDRGSLVLFLTHPYWLDRSDSGAVLNFFLKSVEELASSTNSKFIEVEFHNKITSAIAFPTSLSNFSYDLSKIPIQRNDLSLLRHHGFLEEKTILCYEQNVPEIEKKINKNYVNNDFTIKRVDPSKFMMLKKKASNFPIKSYALSSRDPAFTHIGTAFFSDTIYFAYRRSRWFPLRMGDLAGFLRLSTNFLEFSKEYHSPVPLLFHYLFKKYHFKYGKILDWALRVEDVELFRSLLSHLLYSMKQKGLEKCQIGYVSNEQTFVRKLLEEYGFRKIHTMKLLRKRCGSS